MMVLHLNFPFWLIKNGIIKIYPLLSHNEKCGVVIIGAGISGALAASYLGKEGIKTNVVDKRHAGARSTSARTALLHHGIYIPLQDLIDKLVVDNAVASYHPCVDAIAKIETISKKVETVPSFINECSLQYATQLSHLDKLQNEYKCRKKYRFPVQWLKEEQVSKKFGFKTYGIILSNAEGSVDAYKIIHNTIKNYEAKVFDKIIIEDIQKQKSGFG